VPLFTVPFPDFGGLDLLTPVDENQGAIDLLDVTLDFGVVRARDGYAQVHDFGGVGNFLGYIFQYPSNSGQLIVGDGGNWYAINPANGAVITSQALAHSPAGITAIGTPAASRVYAGDNNTDIYRYDGTTWTALTVAAAQRPVGQLAVTPWDNRLVVAGTHDSTSRVWFSNPGDPENFATTPPASAGYQDLTPGDGEDIQAVAVFRNQLFVFKKSRFFVFYGTAANSIGQPIFNYRTVDTGTGAAGNAVTVCEDGVYFAGYRAGRLAGLYRTVGGEPQLVSGPLQPLFLGDSLTWATTAFGGSTGGANYWNATSLGQWRNLIVLAVQQLGTGLNRTLVYNRQAGTWTAWALPATTSFGISTSKPSSLYFGTSGKINRIGTDLTTDAGASITTPLYRSGFIPFDWRGRTLRSGIHGVEKIVRSSRVTGTGADTRDRDGSQAGR
jgi:hypothetical protein